MPSFDKARRPKLADVRDIAEAESKNPWADRHTRNVASAMLELVDALDPEVAGFCEQRERERERQRGRA